MRSGKRLVVLVNALVLSLIGGAVALGSIPASNGTITACYDKSTKVLRVIDTAKETCKQNEQSISWAQTGPAGPQGPAGAVGETGLQGPGGPSGPEGPAGETGLQGPTGATGAPGADGATGETGLQGAQGSPGVVSFYGRSTMEAVIVEPGNEATLFVFCEAGDSVTGGGFNVGADMVVRNNQAHNTDAAHGWVIQVRNFGDDNSIAFAKVYCVDLG